MTKRSLCAILAGSYLAIAQDGTAEAQVNRIDQPTMALLAESVRVLDSLGYNPQALFALYDGPEEKFRNQGEIVSISFYPETDTTIRRILPEGKRSESFFKGPRITIYICKKTLRSAGYALDGEKFVRLRDCVK